MSLNKFFKYDKDHAALQEKVNKLFSTVNHKDITIDEAIAEIFRFTIIDNDVCKRFLFDPPPMSLMNFWLGIINDITILIPKSEFRVGKFIVLEGTDHSGKTTVQEFIEEKYPNILTTREPGGTGIAEEIRSLILKPNGDGEKMENSTEVLLYYASRAQHIEQVIIPSRQAGINILSSRFFDSSYAYQQAGRNLNPAVLDFLTLFVLVYGGELSIPSGIISIYLEDINLNDIEEKLRIRSASSGVEVDRLELEGKSFLSKTNDYFKELKPLSDVLESNDIRKERAYSFTQTTNDRYKYPVFHIESFRPDIKDLFNDIEQAMITILEEA